MRKITHYRRGSSNNDNWIVLPKTTVRGMIRFVLLGTYKELKLEDGEGTVTIVSISKDKQHEREKLLSTLA